MSKQNTSSKGFAPWRWLKRMFFGASKEYTLADERYDSPGKLAVKRFFRNPLAVIALAILVGMFLFVFIGPIFAPVDLTETGSEMLHVNVRPTMSLMKLPDDMKDGAVDISSRGTFTIGVSTDGNMYTWGYYTHTKDPKLNPLNIPDEVKNAKIVHAAAGTDHAVAISEDGHVYAWGAYDNGQYGWDGSMIASARKQPEELMGDNTIDASQVRQLVAGNQVTAILMEDGTIYAWGNDGLNATNLSSVIKHGKKESKLVKLAFTNDGLYGIDEDGNFVPGKSSKFNTITIQDENGQKMSKSKGNAVDPFDALETHGADAIRWYFYSNSAPWLPNRFYDKAVTEGQRKFLGTIWNTYAFFVLYANIDEFDATKYQLEYDKLSVMDKWILSKLNSLVKSVDSYLNDYKIPETTRVLEEFVDDLSNWYVRRSRERFWAKGMEQDKINAYMTLYTCLVTLCKVAAPMIPFMTEEIYLNLVKSIDKDAPESIHLCDYPVADETYIDKELEKNMDEVLKIVVIGRACRNAANIKNRQPIGKMYVKAPFEVPEFFKEIIEDELNVKAVEFTDDVRAYSSYSFKPQLKTVGPKYGKLLGQIRQALSAIDGNAAMDELNANGMLTFDFGGEKVELTKDDLLIDIAQTEGFESASDNGVTVVLDTNLSPELIEEGFVRELISKIQTMRKEAGFEVMDKITVSSEGNDKIAALLDKNSDTVKAEVLATDIISGEIKGYSKEWNINGETVTLGVSKN